VEVCARVIRSQSAGVVGAAISGLLWQVGAVAAPLMVKQAIDHGVLTTRSHAAGWLGALLVVGLLEMTAGAVRHLYAIRNRARSDARVRDAIFAHALRLDPSYHDRVGPGELMSRASSDSEHVARLMDSIGHTIGYVLTVVAVAIVLLVLDWRLALVVLIPLPLVTLAGWMYSRKYHAKTQFLQESWGKAATLVEETVTGIRVVKGLGAGEPLAAEFRGRSNTIVGRALDIARLDAIFLPVTEFLPMLGLLAVMWLGGRRVIEGDLSLGSFVAFNAYVAMLVWPMRVLGQRVTTLQKAVGASARISEVLDAEPRLKDPRHPEQLERPVRGDVQLAGVEFGHDGDHSILDGLDLHVPPGESLALVGATGSGKSTIAGLLARLYDPDSGVVRLDGHDVRQLRLTDVRRAVALVFEETFLFTDTVRENIRFSRPGRDRRGHRAGRGAGGRGGVHRRPARRLRDPARRARLFALRRPAPTRRDRARDPGGSRGARPRRCNVRGRRDEGARDSRGADDGDAGPHNTGDRASPGDDRARGPRRDPRGRQDRRAGHACGAHAQLDPVPHTARARGGCVMERASARSVWQHTRGLIRPVRGLYFGAAAAVIVSTLITLAGPALVRYAVDAGIKKDDTQPLNVAAVIFLALALIKPWVVRAQILMAAPAGERFLDALRRASFDKLQALPLGFFEQQRAGVLVSRLTSDVQSLNELVREALVEVTGSALQIVLTVVVLAFLSPKLALISLVALPILIASSWSFHHGAGRAYHAIRDRVAETLTALQEGLAGVRVVQAFRREKRTLDHYHPRSQAQVHAWRRASFVNIRLFAFLPLAQAAALIVVLLVASSMYTHGEISIGTITAFVLYLIQLFDPIGRFTEWLGEFRQGLAALSKIVGLLEAPSPIAEKPSAVELPREGALALNDVTFGYGEAACRPRADARVRARRARRARRGDWCRQVDRREARDKAVRPAAGNDRARRRRSPRRDARVTASQIVLLPQEGHLFSGTLADNVRLAQPDASDDEVRRSAASDRGARQVRVAADGLETDVQTRGLRLSAGERQLVGIARVALADPP
jgi:ATP-binding cassette subfamily B protein